MRKELRTSILMLIAMTVVTGVAYPLVVTAIAQIAFSKQANGSLIVQNDKVVGSELIGQPFDDPKYFWSRPSATGPIPYTPFNAEAGTGSTGSNFGPTNPAQIDAVKSRIEAIKKAQPEAADNIPVELVTASGSGLDPQISPAAAEFQLSRVAKVRGVSEDKLRQLVAANTEARTFGVLGEPRVNVLQLNLALDAMQP
jgi:potassium-transporting ATPase KdpC subunit